MRCSRFAEKGQMIGVAIKLIPSIGVDTAQHQ